MDNKKSAKKEIPVISPGLPVIIRMNGDCEEADIGTIYLRKKHPWSDIIFTLLGDCAFSIESRICDRRKDDHHRQTNNCIVTPSQADVIRQILRM